MSRKKKIIISLSIIGMFLISLAVSYAYFSAVIYNNESTSTIVGTAAYLELTFEDGSPEISASDIIPGWSASKTFKVKNTGENTAYYVLKITDITNDLMPQGLSYKIESEDGGANITKDTIPYLPMAVSSVIELPVNTTHNYTITTYYNNLEYDQSTDIGKSFTYSVGIEAVYKREINTIEDLVDISNESKNGNSFEHIFFLLTRDLDFKDSNSYRNPNDASYGDVNGNGVVETIKEELTNENGMGFRGIALKTEISFKGYLDGGNHRIDNLYINNNIAGEVAFINRVQNTTIMNLTISGKSKSTSTTKAVGGLIGNAQTNTVIYNCHNEVDIENVSYDYTSSAGLVQWVYGDTYIKNSSNSGNIKGAETNAGIVSWVSTTNSKKLILENVLNNGEITNDKGIIAGGLVGSIDGSAINTVKIINSKNNAKITLSSSRDSTMYVGGLVGYNKGRTTDVYYSENNGNILGLNNYIGHYINISGGIAKSGEIINSIANIYYTTNNGTIKRTINDYNNSFDTRIAGIGASIIYGSITNCNNTGDVIIEYNSGTVGGRYIGGIYAEKGSTVIATDNTNTGAIRITNTGE